VTPEEAGTTPKSQMQGVCAVKPAIDLFHSPKELGDTSSPDLHPKFNLFFFSSSWKDFFFQKKICSQNCQSNRAVFQLEIFPS